MKEQWKKVKDFPHVEISNKGRARCAQTLLKIYSNEYGYYINTPKRDGHPCRSRFIHRLVADAFLPNPDKKLYPRFNDGNRHNPAIENLVWENPKVERGAKSNAIHSPGLPSGGIRVPPPELNPIVPRHIVERNLAAFREKQAIRKQQGVSW